VSTIAIIGGTGALGGALAKRLSAAGIKVVVGSRDPEKAVRFASEIRSQDGDASISGAGLVEAAEQADICFVTVPYAAHAATLSAIKPAVQGKIVVDATVPLQPPKVGTVQLPAAGSAAIEAAALLGEGVRLVSALQNIGAAKLEKRVDIDADVLVCGDDAEAVEAVRELLGKLGLRSWHAGPLANSAATEAMTSVLIQLNRRYKFSDAGFRITGEMRIASA
jgi:NADPH-dependent F420 reductase